MSNYNQSNQLSGYSRATGMIQSTNDGTGTDVEIVLEYNGTEVDLINETS